jgi:hypothetical protein
MSKNLSKLFLALVAAICLLACSRGCAPDPIGPTPDAGGSVATGGAAPAVATGGAQSAGGAAATGGASDIREPVCGDTMRLPSPEQLEAWQRTLGPKYQPRTTLGPRLSVDISGVNDACWPSLLAISLDQGSVGACTGFAAAGTVSTARFGLRLDNAIALKIYGYATTIDPYPGTYPPTDTGSNGASACKSLIHFGYATSCRSTWFSLQTALTTIGAQPIMWGINWHANSYTPGIDGHIDIGGKIDGGHELGLVALKVLRTATGMIDTAKSRLWSQQSWGNSIGCCLDGHCGYIYVTLDEAQTLIDEGGEFDAPNLP